jgi:hypothetical protein
MCFKDFAPDDMLKTVRNDAFVFLRNMGGEASAYSKAMQDTVFLITDARMLTRVVEGIEGLDMNDTDTMGDVYEYMLGKMAASGTNGQFRTPRPYHPHDGADDETHARRCDLRPRHGFGRIRDGVGTLYQGA